MSILKLNGVELYYELHGEGPPVVFIHGASGTHLTWWQQVAERRHHYSCLIYDQRGFGKSHPTEPYNIGDGNVLYQDLCDLIEHVGFQEKISIVGASLGTGPALQFAMTHKDQIDKPVLVCGTGGATTPLIKESWKRRYERMNARHKQLTSDAPRPADLNAKRRVPPVRSPGEFERFAVAYHPYGPVGEAMHLDSPALTFLYAEIMASAGGPATVDLLLCFHAHPVADKDAAAVQFPVLVVGGTEDPLFAAVELEDLARLFPDGRAKLFKGAGHAAYYERAHRFNDLMLDFLRSGHEV